MLNKNGVRELAYVVKIDNIEPIVGSDHCEAAIVGGWRIMVRKDTFLPGDLAIYFEIDSKVDSSKPEFAFLANKNGKIKTQKYTFGGKGLMISQGLLMTASDLNGYSNIDENNNKYITIYGKDKHYYKGDFLTKELGVVYADPADNKRKSNSVNKYQKMKARHSKLFKNKFVKFLFSKTWGRKILFVFFGKKKDKKGGWPSWVVKTDEERIQNLVPMIPSFQTEKWIATEKIDGTSTTFTMKRKGRKKEFLVCSRNVAFNCPDKKCFYDSNVYTEMSEKYHMKDILTDILNKHKDYSFVTIQGETYGNSIQNRDYSLKDHDLCVFNVIFGQKDGTTNRLNPKEMKEFMAQYKVPTVPIVAENVELPNTCDEILAKAGGPSAIDTLPREGLVFRTYDGKRSFKAVDNNFLLKYHK